MIVDILFYIFAILLTLSAIGVVGFTNAIYSVLSLISAFLSSAILFLLIEAEFLSMIMVIVYVGAVAIMFLFIIMMIHENDQNAITLIHTMKKFGALLCYSLFYAICFMLCFIGLLSALFLSDMYMLYDLNIFDFNITMVTDYFSRSKWVQFNLDKFLLLQLLVVFISGYLAKVFAQYCVLDRLRDLLGKPKLFYLTNIVCFILIVSFIISGQFFVPHEFSEDLISFPMPQGHLISNTKVIGGSLYKDYVLGFQLCGLILLIAMIGVIVLTLNVKHNRKKQNIAKQLQRSSHSTLRVVKVPLGKGIDQ